MAIRSRVPRFAWFVFLALVSVAGCARPALKLIPQSAIVSERAKTAPDGRAIRVVQTTLTDAYEDELDTALLAAEGPQPLAGPPPSSFAGKHRKAAKTSIPNAATECFTSLKKLLATLASDDDMKALSISEEASSDRVTREERMVSVQAYLLAAKFEGDRDYHLILSSTKSGSGPFLNAEISGLVNNADKPTLKAARKAFEDLADIPGSGSYTFYEVVPVTVTGGLFFDVDHPPGEVGPEGFRPDTSWEVHPITEIIYGHSGCSN